MFRLLGKYIFLPLLKAPPRSKPAPRVRAGARRHPRLCSPVSSVYPKRPRGGGFPRPPRASPVGCGGEHAWGLFSSAKLHFSSLCRHTRLRPSGGDTRGFGPSTHLERPRHPPQNQGSLRVTASLHHACPRPVPPHPDPGPGCSAPHGTLASPGRNAFARQRGAGCGCCSCRLCPARVCVCVCVHACACAELSAGSTMGEQSVKRSHSGWGINCPQRALQLEHARRRRVALVRANNGSG